MIGNANKLFCREAKKFVYKVCMQLQVAQDKAFQNDLKYLMDKQVIKNKRTTGERCG